MTNLVLDTLTLCAKNFVFFRSAVSALQANLFVLRCTLLDEIKLMNERTNE